MAIPFLGTIIAGVTSIIDKVVPDKDLKERLKAELNGFLHVEIVSLIEARAKVLVAEMSGNWLQRSWRPILMLVIVGIVANNYLIYPYLNLFGINATPLELPDHLYSLMKIGVGGYVIGRSAEKAVKEYKK